MAGGCLGSGMALPAVDTKTLQTDRQTDRSCVCKWAAVRLALGKYSPLGAELCKAGMCLCGDRALGAGIPFKFS